MLKNLRKFINRHTIRNLQFDALLSCIDIAEFNEMMEENVFLRKIVTACWVFLTPPPLQVFLIIF